MAELPFKAKSEAQVKGICHWLMYGHMDSLPEGPEDYTYLKQVKAQMLENTLPATIIKLIWEYAHGRAMAVAESDDAKDPLDALSNEELQAELAKAGVAIREREPKQRNE